MTTARISRFSVYCFCDFYIYILIQWSASAGAGGWLAVGIMGGLNGGSGMERFGSLHKQQVNSTCSTEYLRGESTSNKIHSTQFRMVFWF